jgi:hypothetical protein
MHASLSWYPGEGSGDRPGVRVDHNKFNEQSPKTLVLMLGDQTIAIQTTEEGLRKIAEAIAGHPEQIKRQAVEEYNKALAALREAGGDVPPTAPVLS